MNRLLIIQLIFVSVLLGCNGQTSNQDASITINKVRISEQIIYEIQEELNKNPIEFEKVNYYYQKVDSIWKEETDTIRNGFYFEKIEESLARNIVQKYSDKISKDGNYIFLNLLNFDKNWKSLYNITIVKADNQYEVLKMINTQAPNYDITNEQIIAKIKEWDDKVGLKLIVVDEDRVEAYIGELPENLKKFTEEVYAFCPDVIDQGYGDMGEMIKDYKANKYFWMWWD